MTRDLKKLEQDYERTGATGLKQANSERANGAG